MFILTTLSLPLISPAISSTIGSRVLHGPHHSAQKSTRTGSLELMTSVSKSVSVTDWSDMAFSLYFTNRYIKYEQVLRFVKSLLIMNYSFVK